MLREGPCALAAAPVERAVHRLAQGTEAADGVTRVFECVHDLGDGGSCGATAPVIAVCAYDSHGNRLQEHRAMGLATATYDDQDRRLTDGGATCTYAPNGELRTKEGGRADDGVLCATNISRRNDDASAPGG